MSTSASRVTRVTELIRDVLLIDEPDPDVDLIDANLIDSLALVSLIIEIEHEFGVALTLEEFDIERFRSARQIAALVDAHDGAASA